MLKPDRRFVSGIAPGKVCKMTLQHFATPCPYSRTGHVQRGATPEEKETAGMPPRRHERQKANTNIRAAGQSCLYGPRRKRKFGARQPATFLLKVCFSTWEIPVAGGPGPRMGRAYLQKRGVFPHYLQPQANAATISVCWDSDRGMLKLKPIDLERSPGGKIYGQGADNGLSSDGGGDLPEV